MAGVSVRFIQGGYRNMPGEAVGMSDRKTGIGMVCTAHGGRLISLQVPVYEGARQRMELLYSNPKLFSALPLVVDRERSVVTWDDVLMGGEKTWIGDQVKWGNGVPYLNPDLGRYDVRIMDNGVHLESPVCRETGMKVIREVTLESGTGKFHIAAWLVNAEGRDDAVAPWSIMQLVKSVKSTQATVSPLMCPPVAFINEGGGKIPEGILSQDGNAYTFDLTKPHKDMFKAAFHVGGEEGKIITTLDAGEGNLVKLYESFPSLVGNMFAHMGRAELFSHNTLRYFEAEVSGRKQYLRQGEQSDVLALDFKVEQKAA